MERGFSGHNGGTWFIVSKLSDATIKRHFDNETGNENADTRKTGRRKTTR